MFDAIKLKSKDVPGALKGDYKGRKYELNAVTSVTIPSDANLWSGGSRDKYYAVHLETGKEATMGDTSAPWDVRRKDRTHTMVPGIVVVRHTIFMGKDMGLTFYVHPDNVVKFLPHQEKADF